jgi:hypothetical protein
MTPFMSGGTCTAGTLGFISSSAFAAPTSTITLSRSTMPTNGCPVVLNVPSLNGSATSGRAWA